MCFVSSLPPPLSALSAGSWLLSPTDPLFPEITAAYLKAQTQLLGTDHMYNADTFNGEAWGRVAVGSRVHLRYPPSRHVESPWSRCCRALPRPPSSTALHHPECAELLPSSNDLAFLEKLSSSLYQAMADVDPEAVWVVQGWMFEFEPYVSMN
jgi:alpha-N-acetylglucosaminidase